MSKLKIAIQKSGRLYEESFQLLKYWGIYVNNGKDHYLILLKAKNVSLENIKEILVSRNR